MRPGSRTADSRGSSLRPTKHLSAHLTNNGGPPTMAASPDDPRQTLQPGSLCDRYHRAAIPESLECPALLQRPRLPPGRHRDGEHHPGRRLARRGSRRQRSRTSDGSRYASSDSRPLGAGRRQRKGLCPPAGTRSRVCMTRNGTARRTIRVFQQRLRDLVRRPRFRLRTPARFLRPVLHRVGQAGTIADCG